MNKFDHISRHRLRNFVPIACLAGAAVAGAWGAVAAYADSSTPASSSVAAATTTTAVAQTPDCLAPVASTTEDTAAPAAPATQETQVTATPQTQVTAAPLTQVTAAPLTEETNPSGTDCGVPVTGTGSSPLPATVTCQTTSTTGAVALDAGQVLCLGQGAVQNGPIVVYPGASLYLDGATVNGAISTYQATTLVACGSTVNGPLVVDGTTGLVLIGGDAATPACAGNVLTSEAEIFSNTGGVEFNNNTVGDGLIIFGNTGNVPAPDSGPVNETGNQVTGPTDVQ